MKKIQIGDRIRCFRVYGNKDTTGENADYFEGIVIAKDKQQEEFRVRIEKCIEEGKEDESHIGADVPMSADPNQIEKLE